MMRILTIASLAILSAQNGSAFQLHSTNCKLPAVTQPRQQQRASIQYWQQNPSIGQRTIGPLFASDSDEESTADSSEEPKEEKNIAGRKKRVILGYKAVMASYFSLAVFILSKGGISKFPLFFAFGNISLPIGIAYILKVAAENDRLTSDTYKRLNLGLLQYGILGGITVHFAAIKQQTSLLAYIPFLLSTINSVKGYVYGALGWDKKSSGPSLLQDFAALIKSTTLGLFKVPKTVQSVCYLVAALLVASLKLSKMVEIFKFLESGSGLSGLSSVLTRYNRLAILTVVMITLKDACDRNRLSGTTFIQLNCLGGLVLAANSAFRGGLTTSVGATAAVLSFFLTVSGLSSYFERNKV